MHDVWENGPGVRFASADDITVEDVLAKTQPGKKWVATDSAGTQRQLTLSLTGSGSSA
ncbi:MAG: hypothetical protein R3E65_11800 [Steroidobacteraceae bacterium]